MLKNLREGLQRAVSKLFKKSVVDEAAIREFSRDLQRALLLSDVNVRLVLQLSKRVEKRLREDKPPPGVSLKEYAVYVLYNELANILGEKEAEPPSPTAGRQLRVLLVGLQGSGKTTAAAKLAMYYKKQGHDVALISVDTYRPGAYDQLKQLADGIGVDSFGGDLGDDPKALAKRGLGLFRDKEVVIVDTAGRHKDELSLMREMEELSSIVKPGITYLVVDGTIGQQAEKQARAFNEVVKVGGIIVTKLDGTAKGGGALTAAAATGASIHFVSTGERIEDFEVFSPTGFAGRLLGLGDIRALIESVEKAFKVDEEKARRISKGRFTLEEFYEQLDGLRRVGPLTRLLELLPGGLDLKITPEQLDGLEEKLKKWRAVLDSMTPHEKESPDVISSSRVKRIARGAGVDERDVKELLKTYTQTKRMIKSLQKTRAKRFMQRIGL